MSGVYRLPGARVEEPAQLTEAERDQKRKLAAASLSEMARQVWHAGGYVAEGRRQYGETDDAGATKRLDDVVETMLAAVEWWKAAR